MPPKFSNTLGKLDQITNDVVLLEVMHIGLTLIACRNVADEKYCTIERLALDYPNTPWRCVHRYQPDRVET